VNRLCEIGENKAMHYTTLQVKYLHTIWTQIWIAVYDICTVCLTIYELSNAICCMLDGIKRVHIRLEDHSHCCWGISMNVTADMVYNNYDKW